MRRLLVGILALLVTLAANAAAPPPLPRHLTPLEQQQVDALDARNFRHAAVGDFEEAARVAEEIATFRAQRQGARHVQAIEARLVAEMSRWLVKVPKKDRAAVLRAADLNTEGLKALDKADFAKADELLREALDLNLKTLGEHHPNTASGYNNVALSQLRQGRHQEVLPMFQRALNIQLKTLGERHPDTATSYNSVASCLDNQGKHGDALPLYQRALAVLREVFGEQYFLTGQAYNNVAQCLDHQGKHHEALTLHYRAQEVLREALGEQHPLLAICYNNAGLCLANQGRHQEALALLRRALNLCRQTFGEEHPSTATSYSSLASCLDNQGKYDEALPLYRSALDITRKLFGELHPLTAQCSSNLAGCLRMKGEFQEALPLYRQALDTFRKVLGEQHQYTATAYHNLAMCLDSQGKPREALPLLYRALDIYRGTVGESHPRTSANYVNLAMCLMKLDKREETARLLQTAIPGYEAERFQVAGTGFDRAMAPTAIKSPHAQLAVLLPKLGQPRNAFRHADLAVGRGLLDDFAATAPADRDRLNALGGELRSLDRRIVPLFGREKLSAPERALRDQLSDRRRVVQNELVRLASEVSAQQALPVDAIQRQIPADAALILWMDYLGEHFGCVLRRDGPPAWVALPGSEKEMAWGPKDVWLPSLAYFALVADFLTNSEKADLLEETDATVRPLLKEALRSRNRPALLEALYRQRLAPLERHLKGVRRLLVVPTGAMSSVPVEALTDSRLVSYVPSGSAFARTAMQHRPLQGDSLLVLADPAFTPTASSDAPPRYVAARGRPARLNASLAGVALGNLPGGVLPTVAAVGSTSPFWPAWSALPGTRVEGEALARLVTSPTRLVGSAASQQTLEELAGSGKLSSYRLIHLATHGEANAAQPRDSALILAQDQLPDGREQAARVLAGKAPLDGRLTVDAVLRTWKLDADLVTLSACESGRGLLTQGEGMLGFAHALLQSGARSVVLSRWKVDDTATSLLMQRFYENLLGKRPGLKKPLGRAEALREAKRWLRELPRAEVEKRASGLRGKTVPLNATPSAAIPAGDRPFAQPYYWAAFVLIGDPD